MRAWILWLAAKYRLKKDQPIVIAVGGAIAKTSTKVAIGAVLEKAFPGQVYVGYGNLNSYLGVPLAVLGFEVDFYEQKVGIWGWLKILVSSIWRMFFSQLPKYLVLEFGTDQPNDIKKITAQLQPNVGVITVVGPAHLANYPQVEAMVEDEGWLAEQTQDDLFINHADPYREQHRARTKAKIHELVMPLELMATEYAKAVGQILGATAEQILQGLQNYQRPKHRFNEQAIGSWQVLDDSYNASPLAMEAALNRLQALPGRHVAILGEMRELGTEEVKFHQEVGRYAQSHADVIIGVGELAKNYQPDQWFATSDDLAKTLLPILKSGDSILVKGSKAVKMDKIIATLENNR